MDALTLTAPSTERTRDARAASLRARLADGHALRVSAWGQPELVAPSGRVVGRPAVDVVTRGVRAGWLAEADRRNLGFGRQDRVVYRLDPSRVPAEGQAADERRLNRVQRARGKSRPLGPATPPPMEDGTECITKAEGARRWKTTSGALRRAISRGSITPGTAYWAPGAKKPATGIALDAKTLAYAERVWLKQKPKTSAAKVTRGTRPSHKPKAAKPRRERKPRRPAPPPTPAAPGPLADGTECITLHEAAERWDATPRKIGEAARVGHIDRGGTYRPEGHTGRDPRSVALTPKTLAYAERVWAAAPARATLAEGEELLQRDLADAFGVGKIQGARRDDLQASVPWRPAPGPGRGKLYRVGPELVAWAGRYGVAVTLAGAPPATPPASGTPPERPAPSGDGHWADVLPEAVATDTPLFA